MATIEALQEFAAANGLTVRAARLVVPDLREVSKSVVRLGSAPAMDFYAGKRGFVVAVSRFTTSLAFSVGQPSPGFYIDRPVETLEILVGVPVFVHRMLMPQGLVAWLSVATNASLIRDLVPSPKERVRVLQNGLEGYFDPQSDLASLSENLTKLVEALPIAEEEPLVVIELVPQNLRGIVPLALRYGIADDDEREKLLRSCPADEVQALVNEVQPLLPEIDRYLDGVSARPPEIASRFGALAEFVLESLRSDA